MQAARTQRQARNALDAFGHATLVVRDATAACVWQTALARSCCANYFGGAETVTPPEVIAWLARESLRRRAGADPPQPDWSARAARAASPGTLR
jgi:hypothetical protein